MSQMIDNINREYSVKEIFSAVKSSSKERKFPESLELILQLNVDPTQGDQNVRGTCVLPAGTGQTIRVAVFADKEFHDQIKEAGADLIGDDKLIKEIGEGTLNFDKIIATPEHMQGLKTLARVLGPKGLMPNVKSGTLVKADDLLGAVKSSK
jgi:large subunit ribosomal protein L1